jgi:hypothetical protein
MIKNLKDETIIGDLLRAYDKQIQADSKRTTALAVKVKEQEVEILELRNKLWLVARQLEDVTVPKDGLPKLWWLKVDELKPPGVE